MSDLNFNQIKGFIFDIDGTLLDSNDAHAESFRRAFSENGYEVSFGSIRRLIGMGSDLLIPELVTFSSESEEGKKIKKAKDRIFEEEFFRELKPFPGAQELVRGLAKKGYKLTVATSASKQDLTKFLKRLDLENEFKNAVSSDDAENSKPEPDIVLAALKKLNLDTHQAVMVGDTPYDIEAARKAGVKTIAFRTGEWVDSALTDAALILNGPEDLLNRVMRS